MTKAHIPVSSDNSDQVGEYDTSVHSEEFHQPVSSEETGVVETSTVDADLFESDFMIATHGGGELERVAGFCSDKAMTEGFESESIEIEEDVATLPTAWQDEFEEPEDVCGGSDERTPIQQTSQIPWRTICQLFITRRDGARTRGTGWFIGPRTVVTAGHCVYSHKANGWARHIVVVPGMNSSFRPFGSVTGKSFRSVRGWTTRRQVAADYGAIVLPNNAMGNRTGWFGFAALNNSALTNLLIQNAGYAGDKPVGTLWYNAGRVTQIRPQRMLYMLDTYGGHSGSPVFFTRDGRRTAVGIHNYGGCPNKCTRINRAVFNNLKRWKGLSA